MIVYTDDICIVAKDEEQAIERLETVLQRASEAGLNINWKKCQFLVTKTEFLGHRVDNCFIRSSELKTVAVQNFKEPTNVKQVQKFLGLTGYFRKFIHGYSTIARPLSNLTRNDVKFVFEREQKAAFDMLKLEQNNNNSNDFSLRNGKMCTNIQTVVNYWLYQSQWKWK